MACQSSTEGEPQRDSVSQNLATVDSAILMGPASAEWTTSSPPQECVEEVSVSTGLTSYMLPGQQR